MDTDETRIGNMLEIEGEHPDKLLHRDVTEKIIGSAFEVHGELGYGFLERVYERAMQVELIRRGSTAEIEKRVQVQYKKVVVGDYDSDLIVDGCVLVELKVNPQYDRRDEAQLLNVLKATGLKVGLLVNFGRSKVEYKRLVF
jgi:GxxExxY protein